MAEDHAVKHQWQIELGGCRVETLKSVTGVTIDQEYVELLQNSPDGKPVPDLVLGAPSFFGSMTLTRGKDKSDKFTQRILDSRDPTKTEASAEDIILVYVNAQNDSVRKFQLAGARPTSWSAADLAAGETGQVDETLELKFASCGPV
ncbi:MULTISPECIES: phage tail protein [unclassified Streptomyces]|uniref:phage tail protein n=1 Tax=unclassified Streptomyces TaxID=2593676 RepID=UPI002E2C4226|nr:phage tail protein [Streptomyces sp. NBC_01423]WSX95124.1 phage tail protein [Streptomyces sp. NBC_00891]WSY09604.1 phage tail protein [Streptomyces sp. NBC_00890]WSZ11224.1 phage tail protein [Streptomyces sp. NBC_00869]WSZ21271.1 phage tail protein [Streptomyces sp. NBC_00870]